MNNGGLIKLIVIIIIGIIVLSVFNVNLRSIVNNKLIGENLLFLWNSLKNVWHDYLQKPTNFIWGVFYNDVWLTLVDKKINTKFSQ